MKHKAADGIWETIRSLSHHASDRYALFVGDAVRALAMLPTCSVDTCLTSPPYWGARDYGHPAQLGLEPNVDEYVGHLVEVFRQVRRVLRDDGVAWLNVGDCYFHGSGTIGGRPPERGWKRNKQLVLVPFRLALALQEDGWWIRNVLVWHKPNAMPSSVTDRLTNSWEPVLLMAKSEHYYFDLDAVRLPHRTSDSVERRRAENGNGNGKAKGKEDLRRWLNSPRHRATIEGMREIRRRPNVPDPVELAAYLRSALARKGKTLHWVARQLDLPFERTRHYFRTDAIGSRLPPEETWLRLKRLLDLGDEFDEAMEVEVGDNVFRNHPKGRNPGDLLSVGVSGGSGYHFATMPLALARHCLKASLPDGGIALDPFMGSGTTGLAALELKGRFVGADLRREYCDEFLKRAKKVPVASTQLKLLGA